MSLNFIFFNFETLVMHVNIIWFQVWNLQQVREFFGKILDLNWANLKALYVLPLTFAPFPPIRTCSIWPLWGLNSHFLREGKGPNQQAIFISNNLDCFPFALSMYCIFNFLISRIVVNLYFRASNLNSFAF